MRRRSYSLTALASEPDSGLGAANCFQLPGRRHVCGPEGSDLCPEGWSWPVTIVSDTFCTGTISRGATPPPNPWRVLSVIIPLNPSTLCVCVCVRVPSRSLVFCAGSSTSTALVFPLPRFFPFVRTSVTVHLVLPWNSTYLFSLLYDIKALPTACSRLQTWTRSHFGPQAESGMKYLFPVLSWLGWLFISLVFPSDPIMSHQKCQSCLNLNKTIQERCCGFLPPPWSILERVKKGNVTSDTFHSDPESLLDPFSGKK